MRLTKLDSPAGSPRTIGVRSRRPITAPGQVARRPILIAALSFCCLLGAVAPVRSAAGEGQLGHVDFEVSCNSPAQATFNEAVAWLHSFEYERAGATFGDVLDHDSSCAMAYWGLAQSLWHQLWVTPPSPSDLALSAALFRF